MSDYLAQHIEDLRLGESLSPAAAVAPDRAETGEKEVLVGFPCRSYLNYRTSALTHSLGYSRRVIGSLRLPFSWSQGPPALAE